MPICALLADENLAVQKLVELTLGKEGMEVITTDNGLSALDIAIKDPPDIILADFKLEGLDIFSFVQKAKKRERLSDIPIILLVDSTETFDPIYLQSLGVEAFFKKPIDTQELTEGIKNLTMISPVDTDTSEASNDPETSDLSQHFSSSAEETETISHMLGWSSPADTLNERPSGEAVREEEEQTILSSNSASDASDTMEAFPFSQDEPMAPDASEDEATIMASPSDFSSEAAVEPPFEASLPDAPSDEPSIERLQDAVNEPNASLTPSQETVSETIASPLLGEVDPFAPPEEALGGGTYPDDTFFSPSPPESAMPNPSENEPEAFQTATQEQDTSSLAHEKLEEDVQEPDLLSPSFPSIEEEDFIDAGTKAADSDAPSADEQGAGPAVNERIIQASVEKIVQESLPDLVKSTVSNEMIAGIVEGIVWEVVTPLAEAEIKKAIKQLQSSQE